ncbi:MAG: hypothetical protein QM758_15345 [Armatimonas sp.]
MKMAWFGLRLMVLSLLLFMLGCTGSNGDKLPSERKIYRLDYTFYNESSSRAVVVVKDIPANIEGDMTADPGLSQDISRAGYFTTDPHTTVLAIVEDAATGTELGRVQKEGIEVGDEEVTRVAVTWNGTSVQVTFNHVIP